MVGIDVWLKTIILLLVPGKERRCTPNAICGQLGDLTLPKAAKDYGLQLVKLLCEIVFKLIERFHPEYQVREHQLEVTQETPARERRRARN
jgi:hypothetical protein